LEAWRLKAAVAYISSGNLKNFEIPLPPLALQTRFADFARAADKSNCNF
jgi:restriction endonuclease S subunit